MFFHNFRQICQSALLQKKELIVLIPILIYKLLRVYALTYQYEFSKKAYCPDERQDI